MAGSADAVRLQMLAWGYSRVLTIELAYPTCGTWRGELAEEQGWYPCPVCPQAAKVCHMIDGYTRRAILTDWRQVSKALSDRAREWIMCENFLEDRSHLRRQREIRTRNRLYRGQTLTSAH